MIDERKLIKELHTWDMQELYLPAHFEDLIETQPKVGEWIPIKFRETTDDDGIDKEEHPIMLDCPLPDHGQEVFISTKSGYVMEDTFYDDDGAYLEDNDWDEVAAWMPLPEPYKEVDDGNN